MKKFFSAIANGVKSVGRWINGQIEWVKSFMSEPDKKGSFKRIGSAAVILTFIKAYVSVSISTKTIVDIPQGWSVTICILLGITAVDKLISYYISMKTGPGTNSNTNAPAATI